MLICTVVFSAVLIQYPGSIKVWIISISRAEKVQQGSGIIRIDLLVIFTKAIAAIYVLSLAEFTEEHSSTKCVVAGEFVLLQLRKLYKY